MREGKRKGGCTDRTLPVRISLLSNFPFYAMIEYNIDRRAY